MLLGVALCPGRYGGYRRRRRLDRQGAADQERALWQRRRLHGRQREEAKVSLRFTLYCDDIFVDQYVSSGTKPSKGALDGNRVGAKAFVFGIYSGPAASGPGTQVADWTLNGKFTRPTHFDGRIEYEAATSPEPITARPQCLDAKRSTSTCSRRNDGGIQAGAGTVKRRFAGMRHLFPARSVAQILRTCLPARPSSASVMCSPPASCRRTCR